MFLEGEALEYYVHTFAPGEPFEEVRKTFEKRYILPVFDAEATLCALVQEPGEYLVQWESRLTRRAHELDPNITDARIVSMFLRGMRDQSRIKEIQLARQAREMAAGKPMALRHMVEMVNTQFAIDQMYGTSEKPIMIDALSTAELVISAMQSGQKKGKEFHGFKCFYCNSEGHTQAYCPKKKQDALRLPPTGSVQKRLCFRCNSADHIKRDCDKACQKSHAGPGVPCQHPF